jgi:hypothetical protein
MWSPQIVECHVMAPHEHAACKATQIVSTADLTIETEQVRFHITWTPALFSICTVRRMEIFCGKKRESEKNGSSVLEVAAYGAVGMPKIAPRSDASLPRHSCD